MSFLKVAACVFVLTTTSGFKRKEVAKEAFEFLRVHAKPYPEDPSQWECWEAYDLHRAAKELYGTKPLPKIKMPEDGYKKGCYVPYALPTELEYEALYFKIDYLIQVGEG